MSRAVRLNRVSRSSCARPTSRPARARSAAIVSLGGAIRHGPRITPGRQRNQQDETQSRQEHPRAEPPKARLKRVGRGRERASLGGGTEHLEIERQIAGRLGTIGGLLLETASEETSYAGWQHRYRAIDWRRILAQDGCMGFDDGGPLERVRGRQHFVQHDAEGEDIRARRRRLSQKLFWRHVADRAEDDAAARGRARHVIRCSTCDTSWPERPKSRILTRPSRVTKTFSGLRSR